MYAYRPRGSGVGPLTFILVLVLLGAVAYLLYRDTQEKENENIEVITQEDGTKVFFGIEPVDCTGDVWVKKTECSRDGFILDGTPGNCGEGEEEWVLDPEAPGYIAAIGAEGKCPTEMRACEVECDIPCQGDTWFDGECKRDGIVLDGSAERCGQGMLEKTLDENASDFVPARGNGSCTKNYGTACFVECPPDIPPPPVCVYQTTWQKSANGCVKSKDDKADPVGYDETGWQELFKLALEAENCTGEKRLVEWETCKGPPAPVNCEGTWGTGDGWGICTGECDRQPSQSRTFTRTKEAAHGGTCTLPAHETTQTRNCGSIEACPVDCSGYWQDPPCPSFCGYSGGSVANNWITTRWPVGDGTECPAPSTKDCPAQDPCPINCQGYHENPACPTACGNAATTLTKKWITTVTPNSTGTACPADESKSCSATAECPINCEGYHEDPACPTACGSAATTLTKSWITTVTPNSTGTACPADGSKYCPATAVCPVNCQGSWSNSGGSYWISPTPCGKTKKKQDQVYTITRNKVGTGSNCAWPNGDTRTVNAVPEEEKTRRCKSH